MSTAMAMASAASSSAAAATTTAISNSTNTTASPATTNTTKTITTSEVPLEPASNMAPIALEIEDSGRNDAADLEHGAAKSLEQRKTTVVHTCPRPPGGYKYSMEFLYGIGSGMAGIPLNIPTPSSITPRTVRSTPPLLSTHMPLLTNMGVSPPRPSGIRYAGPAGGSNGTTAAASTPPSTTVTTSSGSPGSGAEAITSTVSSSGLPAAGLPAAQFICQGYMPTGPQRRLWHAENAVWQFDRNYPYNQAYSPPYGIPMMPVGFEHPYGQRIIYPGYYNQTPPGINPAAVAGLTRTSRPVTQQPHILTQPAVGTTESSEEAPATLGNAPQVSNTWRYGRPGTHRGRHAVPAAATPAVLHRDSKTFYNSIGSGVANGPRFKAPFVANVRNFQAGAVATVAAGGAATTAVVATSAPATGAASSSDQNVANKRNHQGAATQNHHRNRHNAKKGGKNSVAKELTSNSSESLSNSSSKSQLNKRPSSSSSISPIKHPHRNYRNRMRYTATEPSEQKAVPTTVPVSNYQPPTVRRTSKFQGSNAYQAHTAPGRQQSRYYQSRHMDGYVFQSGHYMVYAAGAPPVGLGAGKSPVSEATGAPPGAAAAAAPAEAAVGGGAAAAPVTASSATLEGEQPLDSDFDQRQEFADLGLDPANGGFSSDLEPTGIKQDTSELDTRSCLLSHPNSEVDGDDNQSVASFAPGVESDDSDSGLSDASVESMARDILVSCLAMATGAQKPDLTGPNLVPYGDMHYLKELDRKNPQTNGYRSHRPYHHSHYAYHSQMSPRGLSCCGDMLNQHSGDLVFKLDQNQPDGIESGQKIFLREITEHPDNISMASNLSCSPSASSSKSVLAPMASKSNIAMPEENNDQDELPLVVHNRYWREFFGYTPADRFLLRAKFVEMRRPPKVMGCKIKWDPLSQSVWKKFLESQQTRHVYKIKMRLWRAIYTVAMKNYPRYGLYLVGSSISYFGSKCSDMDICMLACTNPNVDPRTEAVYHLHVMKELLGRTNMFQDFNLIEARVPILRFTDRCHKVEVDINFNNSVGIRNTHLLYCYSQLDWRVRPMALTVKQWAQYHNINNAKNMTISSYSLMLMVIHFLQVGASPPVLPCLHNLYPDKFGLLQPNDFGYVDMNEVMAPYQSDNSQSLGDLLLGFLRYYSVFEYGKYAISIRVGGVLPIEVCRAATAPKNDIHQWIELCIEEPFDQTNTARSVYDTDTFERIKTIFVASYRRLESTRNLRAIFEEYDGPTILMQQPSVDSEVELYEGQQHRLLPNRSSSRSNSAIPSPRPSILMVDKATTAIWDDINYKPDPPLSHSNNYDATNECTGNGSLVGPKDNSVADKPPIA
ncbi:poly(A) RNA polymerase gld-2 homolog A [Drosophila sechellia]|uniref:GM26408 n=1 Tax=Drosophila sechellia TaxID=7238 RepID=B4HE49_DROSE|nr:poly(A) RNA polymerase gld-2 homolog A [Drosophila sechellia]EDW43146.1 GM26408 [Drosophila sechellia]